MTAKPDILKRIVLRKREEVAAVRDKSHAWRSQAEALPLPPNFLEALRGYDQIRVIAEIKKASPSAGVIRPDFDPPAIAKSYQQGGAACLSVLTDQDFFQGSIEDLHAVAQTVPLPILRKDFVIDPVQVYEARLAGAAAVLLIAECLEPIELRDLLTVIESLHMTALVELHDPANLGPVVKSGAQLIGVNNRNLRTFETTLAHTLDLLADIPVDRTVVSESGIRSREDVQKLQSAGVHAILVGEAFMRSPDPGAKLAELIGS